MLGAFWGKVKWGEERRHFGKIPREKKFGARLVLTLVEVLWEKYAEGWGVGGEKGPEGNLADLCGGKGCYWAGAGQAKVGLALLIELSPEFI